MKKYIEEIAQQILKEHPDKNVVFVSEDKQAFFNKQASKNHASERDVKVFPFYRSGNEPKIETVTNVEEMQDVLEERQAVIEAITKVVEKADHAIEVNVDTDPVLASVIALRDNLGNDLNKLANELVAVEKDRDSLLEALEKKATEIESLKKELKASKTKNAN